MAINEHYYEVLDVFSDLFIFMFDELNKRCKDEIEAVRAQHPFEDLVYTRPSLRITYAEGIALLREAGIDISDHDDLSTPNEKLLGKLVKEKYGTEFFMMDKYPLSVRPFYTMPCPEDASLSNSYDFFIRGEEILSGAQRVHDPELLAERAAANDIPLHTIQGYVDSFKHGALPHGGGGVGLERVVMLFLGLPNIRKSSLFPRDPVRYGTKFILIEHFGDPQLVVFATQHSVYIADIWRCSDVVNSAAPFDPIKFLGGVGPTGSAALKIYGIFNWLPRGGHLVTLFLTVPFKLPISHCILSASATAHGH